ncbi:MAG: tetraacyldisaccharide 4'-kinase [Parvibaculales bacterium]
MKAPRFWQQPPTLLSHILLPLGAAYSMAGQTRLKMATPNHCGRPVICVGNINMGGTGKTPVSLMLVELLQQAQIQTAILSRGYKGTISSQTPTHVDLQKHDANMVGDEPFMMAHHASVFIGAEREAVARFALQSQHQKLGQMPDVFIMDDGLQNPQLKRAYNLAVIDAEIGFGNGRVFPAGPLREKPENALKRLNGVIIMHPIWDFKTPQPKGAMRNDVAQFIASCEAQGIDVFHACLKPKADIQPQENANYIAFCGIGRGDKFFNMLTGLGFALSETIEYPDHHAYSLRDAEKILELADQHKANIVTTEKDHMRLLGLPAPDPRAKLSQKLQTVPITCALAEAQNLLNRLQTAMADDMQSRYYTNFEALI